MSSGSVQVEEGDFLEIVTQAQRVVVHFYHRDFERCKLLDKHLQVLARKYFDTRFIKLSAPVSVSVCCAFSSQPEHPQQGLALHLLQEEHLSAVSGLYEEPATALLTPGGSLSQSPDTYQRAQAARSVQLEGVSWLCYFTAELRTRMAKVCCAGRALLHSEAECQGAAVPDHVFRWRRRRQGVWL